VGMMMMMVVVVVIVMMIIVKAGMVMMMMIHNPKYYFVESFSNSLPNIKLNSTTTQESENLIKFRKSSNTYGYAEIPTNLLKIISV
jgi:flagellar basal body-associated protein FliL